MPSVRALRPLARRTAAGPVVTGAFLAMTAVLGAVAVASASTGVGRLDQGAPAMGAPLALLGLLLVVAASTGLVATRLGRRRRVRRRQGKTLTALRHLHVCGMPAAYEPAPSPAAVDDRVQALRIRALEATLEDQAARLERALEESASARSVERERALLVVRALSGTLAGVPAEQALARIEVALLRLEDTASFDRPRLPRRTATPVTPATPAPPVTPVTPAMPAPMPAAPPNQPAPDVAPPSGTVAAVSATVLPVPAPPDVVPERRSHGRLRLGRRAA